MAKHLLTAGHSATHVFDLPRGHRTPDSEINEYSVREQCVVLTKDADFVNSFYLSKRPFKLLLISTGNISNDELDALFRANIVTIAEHFLDFDLSN